MNIVWLTHFCEYLLYILFYSIRYSDVVALKKNNRKNASLSIYQFRLQSIYESWKSSDTEKFFSGMEFEIWFVQAGQFFFCHNLLRSIGYTSKLLSGYF